MCKYHQALLKGLKSGFWILGHIKVKQFVRNGFLTFTML